MNMKPRKVLTGNGDEQEEYPRIHESGDREEAAAAVAGWEGSPPVHHAPRRIAYLVTWDTALLFLLLLLFLLRVCKRAHRSREFTEKSFRIRGRVVLRQLHYAVSRRESSCRVFSLSLALSLTSYSRTFPHAGVPHTNERIRANEPIRTSRTTTTTLLGGRPLARSSLRRRARLYACVDMHRVTHSCRPRVYIYVYIYMYLRYLACVRCYVHGDGCTRRWNVKTLPASAMETDKRDAQKVETSRRRRWWWNKARRRDYTSDTKKGEDARSGEKTFLNDVKCDVSGACTDDRPSCSHRRVARSIDRLGYLRRSASSGKGGGVGEEAREEGRRRGSRHAQWSAPDCLVVDLTGCARMSNLSDSFSASRPARRCVCMLVCICYTYVCVCVCGTRIKIEADRGYENVVKPHFSSVTV